MNNIDNPREYISEDMKKWTTLLHLSSILGFVIILGNIIGPSMMWLLRRAESDYINQHGKQAVNFQFTMVIASLLCVPFMFSFGLKMFVGLFVVNTISVICAARAAYYGRPFRYFFSMNLLDFNWFSRAERV